MRIAAQGPTVRFTFYGYACGAGKRAEVGRGVKENFGQRWILETLAKSRCAGLNIEHRTSNIEGSELDSGRTLED